MLENDTMIKNHRLLYNSHIKKLFFFVERKTQQNCHFEKSPLKKKDHVKESEKYWLEQPKQQQQKMQYSCIYNELCLYINIPRPLSD